MPIAVQCTCGKAFKVRDDFAGTVAKCQICGRDVPVPSIPQQTQAPEPRPVTSVVEPPALPVQTAEAGRPCPQCGEPAQQGLAACKYCGEPLQASLTPEEVLQLQQARIATIEEHHASGNELMDGELRGPLLMKRTVVGMVLSAISVALVVLGARMHVDDGVPLVVVGVILCIGAVIGLLVSLSNDIGSSRIQTSDDAAQAYRRYIGAIMSGRTGKAYAAVAPGARDLGSVPGLKFEKIPPTPGPFEISSLETFGKYWKGVRTGPSGQTRTMRVLKVKNVGKIADDVDVVEAKVEFGNYPTALVFLVLLNIIIAFIVIAIVTKHEKRTIRKLMVRRNGLWYVMESEFVGPLDRVADEAKLEGTG